MADAKQELQEPNLSAETQNQEKPQKHLEDQHLVQLQVQDPNPTVGFDMDGEDFIFSDEAFASDLPDFRCLSSPSTSPSPLTKITHAASSSSSSSSSTSSPWPFLHAQNKSSTEIIARGKQQQQEHTDRTAEIQLDIDLLGDVDLFDLSVPWDPSSLFPDDMNLDEVPFNLEPPKSDETKINTNKESATQGGEKEEEEEDLGSFFLEWLKNNKDTISPEDLRTIRLKKSTIDCAARRLGGGRNARMQLLKLILAWVQNHHLQKKRKRCKEKNEEPCMNFNPPPINPNPNPNVELDIGGAVNLCNSWFPPSDLYSFPQSCTTTSVVVNSQPISPISDLHATDPTYSPWTQNYNTNFQGYPSLTTSAGLPPTQYGTGNILYHQQHATREARKKRMARQRRISSLHQNRAMAHVANSNRNNMAFWSSYSSNSQQGKGVMDLCLPPDGIDMRHQVKLTLHGSGFRSGVSGSERRHMQCMKPHEKNLRFLLQKVLKQSDVGSLGRIVLPKKEAEIHLPELDSRDGITIPMEDISTSCVWNMRYRFWPNNKSRMYLLENTGDFVRSNGLEEGDFIVIYSDVLTGKYMIRGVKIRHAEERGADQVQDKGNLENNCEENIASFSANSRKVGG